MPKGVPKGSPKGVKIDQKEVSRRHLKKGTKKAPKTMIFMTLKCGSSIVNSCKIDVFQCSVLDFFWISFWRCLGKPNGGQGHQQATSRNTFKKHMPKMNPDWSQKGSHIHLLGLQSRSKTDQKESWERSGKGYSKKVEF